MFFNLAGVLLFLPFLTPFTNFIASTSGGVARQLANAHTIFNAVNTAIQLPFAGLIAALIQRLIPAQTETLYAGARFLDEKLLDTAPAETEQTEEAAATTKWRCKLCGYEVEMDELPDDYTCPICGAGPEEFEKVE